MRLFFKLLALTLFSISCTNAIPKFSSSINSSVLNEIPGETKIAPTMLLNRSLSQLPIAENLPIEFVIEFSEEINATSFDTSKIQHLGSMQIEEWQIIEITPNLKYSLQIIKIKKGGTVLPYISDISILTTNLDFFSATPINSENEVTYQVSDYPDANQTLTSTTNAEDLVYMDRFGHFRQMSAHRRILDITHNEGRAQLSVGTFNQKEFSIGDKLLIHVSGADTTNSSCKSSVGSFNFATIKSVNESSGFIELNSDYLSPVPNNLVPTKLSSFCFVQIVRVPQFKNLQIAADQILSAGAFNFKDISKPLGGGILAFAVYGTFTLDGQISMNAKGFSGGGFDAQLDQVFGGEGWAGLGETEVTPATGNGGAASIIELFGGAGGGNAGIGGHGKNTSPFNYNSAGGQPTILCGGPPQRICSPITDQRTFFGGGGGGGDKITLTVEAVETEIETRGGKGGGIIMIRTPKIISTSGKIGIITAQGENSNGTSGAGAGGSIFINAKEIIAERHIWSADGGSNLGANSNHQLRNGGGGLIAINHCGLLGQLPHALGVAAAHPPSMTFDSSRLEIARGGQLEIKSDFCDSPAPVLSVALADFTSSLNSYIGCIGTTEYTSTLTFSLMSTIPAGANIIGVRMRMQGYKINEWKNELSYLAMELINADTGIAQGSVIPWASTPSLATTNPTLKINVGSVSTSGDLRLPFKTNFSSELSATGIPVNSQFKVKLYRARETLTPACPSGLTDKFYFETTAGKKPQIEILYK
jgi:hypothetical protein